MSTSSSTPSAKKATNVTAISASSAQDAKKAASAAQDIASQMMAGSADAWKQVYEKSIADFQQAQDKFAAFGEETSKTLTKGNKDIHKNFDDAAAMTRETFEAASQSGTIAAEAARTTAEELYNYANELFSDQVEHTKKLFGCRTANDILELYKQYTTASADKMCNRALKVSGNAFKYAQEAAEPLQSRAAKTAKKMNSAFAA